MRYLQTTTNLTPARARTRVSYGVLAGTLILVLTTFVGCVPGAQSELLDGLELRTTATPRPAPVASSRTNHAPNVAVMAPSQPLALIGDPNFHPDLLEAPARFWYDELWNALSSSAYVASSTDMARRDDLYVYGRALHTLMNAVLTAFRVTGDLALLDEVDRLAEHMRSTLADGWRGTRDGSNGTRDGYLNWVHKADTTAHRGKDLHVFDEMRTHALVAEFTWAFHANRTLESPNGVPYGERADVWRAYLVDHFEAKWRERNGIGRTAFPFLEHDSLHSNMAFAKYHHYMAQLLGSNRHRQESDRLSAWVLGHFEAVDVGGERAVVWPRRLDAERDEHYLQPAIYGRYVVMDAVTLHLEGAARWADVRLIESMAVTLREFIMELGLDETAFRRDVGGGVTRGGIPPTAASEFGPITVNQYAVSSYALLAAWDASGVIAERTGVVHVERSQRVPVVHLPAAMLLAQTYDRRADASSR